MSLLRTGRGRRPARALRCGAAALLSAALAVASSGTPSHADGGWLPPMPGPRLAPIAAQTLSTTTDPSFSFTGYLNGESFQNALVSFNGYQYAALWNDLGQVVLARHALPAGRWQSITFTDYTLTTSDSHRAISIGIDHLDGSIHLMFDMHASPMNYRASVPGLATAPATAVWATSSFGAVSHELAVGDSVRFTYPQFVNTPDGGLELFIRDGVSSAGNELLYRRVGTAWTDLGTIIDGEGERGSYLFGAGYAGNRLELAWTWRETGSPNSNHDILYATSDDLGTTWADNDGTPVATAGTAPMRLGTPGLVVVPITTGRGLHNQESMAIDSQGNPHVLASYLPPYAPDNDYWIGARRTAVLVHVHRDGDGRWHQIFSHIREGTTRSQLGFDAYDDAFIVTGGATNGSDGLKALRVLTATPRHDWTDLTTRYTSVPSGIECDPIIDRPLLQTTNQLSAYYLARRGQVLKVGQWRVGQAAIHR